MVVVIGSALLGSVERQGMLASFFTGAIQADNLEDVGSMVEGERRMKGESSVDVRSLCSSETPHLAAETLEAEG
jgi:hypothetical protein